MHLQFRRALTASVLPMVCLTAFAQKTVTGTVKDASGEPLIGVTVFVDGKPGSITDIDGNFSIPNASPSSKVKISYIGYKEQTITLGNSSTINIVLQEDNAQLDEVVVVGYGTMKKSDLTGSVSSADGAKLAAKGTTSAMEALQGSVPGAQITQATGRAGSDFNIQIRGKSSIQGTSKPIYVVDGVICEDIGFLNTQDIERMDILKDASSTAIFGSRATAGVVIVTTKSGSSLAGKSEEKVSISYDGYYGVSKIARMPDYMNADQFYKWRFSQFLSSGQVANGIATVAQPTWKMTQQDFLQGMLADTEDGTSVLKNMLNNGEGYNWPDLVTQDGQKQNHFLAVNGSSKNTHYHFGVGYNREEGVYKNDLQNRYNMKGSVDSKINKYLSAGFTLNLAYTENQWASDDAVKDAFRQVPFARPYASDGSFNVKPGNFESMGTKANQFTDTVNPLIYLRDDSKESNTFRVLGNIYVQLKPVEWLSFKTTFSPNYVNSRTGEYTASSGSRTETSSHEEYTRKDWTWDNQIDFTKTFGDHSLSAMGLFSMTSSDRMYSQVGRTSADATSIMTGTKWYNMYTGTIFEKDPKDSGIGTGTAYWEETMMSYALRLNYSYKGKYMFTGTVRTDGSSKFLKDSRWGWFPSAALAWRISEEDFMKNISWIDNLKLRLSYGVTGNNTVCGHYNSVGVSGPNIYAFGSVVANGYYPSGVINADLKWEKSYETNFGIDYGFLNNRINGSIDLYSKTSKDLLYLRHLPLVSGGGSLWDNVGEVQNRGIEFALNTVNIQTKDWYWTTSFNFARNINKVKKINGENKIIDSDYPITSSLFVGSPMNSLYLYKWDGVVSDKNITVPNNDAAVNAGFTPGDQVRSCDYYHKVYGWSEGMPIIKDNDGNGVINADDKMILGCQDPSWTGNISSTLQYKDWDFSFSIYTKQNFTVYSNTLADTYDYAYRGWNKIAMDYYIPAGTLIDCDGVNADGTYINPVYQETTHYGSFPFTNSSITNNGAGSASYEKNVYNALAVDKISYWKVKNITLGYTFPKKLLSSWGCQYLRLYVNITNPFVFTKYKGFDPEWADAAKKNDGPSTVTYQIGASIKF
ncbi:TonB-dependent receptor [uncultured Prevotella sp.]|uniref:SusC/RagA family TonB-linked outer membrane protein n=1 Tax=uncultured Prevotella sp. TaxID=159272 RepID=UPI0025965627|nr:TonB-dependent receptor [uncultured Prevotella sp.]